MSRCSVGVLEPYALVPDMCQMNQGVGGFGARTGEYKRQDPGPTGAYGYVLCTAVS